MPKCGHCADTNHKPEECDCQESGLKCSLCGCNHSSLDRRCKKYRAAKREAANSAVEKITKIKTDINKKKLRDISFNEPQSSKNTTTYSQIVQNPEQMKDITKIAQIEKESNSLKIENSNRKSEIDQTINKKEYQSGLSSLSQAIQSSNILAQRLTDTVEKLEKNMMLIAKKECQELKTEIDLQLIHQ